MTKLRSSRWLYIQIRSVYHLICPDHTYPTSGAPGADEAFKSQCLFQCSELQLDLTPLVVSKAFQVLSDDNLRAAFDSNPNTDPTQRGGGMPSRGGGEMHPGFGSGGMYTEINPEDLFNAFFGGGGNQFGGSPFGNANGTPALSSVHSVGQSNKVSVPQLTLAVFTFGGPGGFRTQYGGPQRRRPGQGQADPPNSPMIALLPLFILFAFALLSFLPALFSTPAPPDPRYAFEGSSQFDAARNTWHRGIPYWVNRGEWEKSALWESVPEGRRGQVDAAMYSSKVRAFERTVESHYVQNLRNEVSR